MRCCAVSVPSNIAEGRGRETPGNKKEFLRFLVIARGSLYELQTQVILAKELGLLSEDNISDKILELRKMLSSFIKSVA